MGKGQLICISNLNYFILYFKGSLYCINLILVIKCRQWLWTFVMGTRCWSLRSETKYILIEGFHCHFVWHLMVDWNIYSFCINPTHINYGWTILFIHGVDQWLYALFTSFVSLKPKLLVESYAWYNNIKNNFRLLIRSVITWLFLTMWTFACDVQIPLFSYDLFSFILLLFKDFLTGILASFNDSTEIWISFFDCFLN